MRTWMAFAVGAAAASLAGVQACNLSSDGGAPSDAGTDGTVVDAAGFDVTPPPPNDAGVDGQDAPADVGVDACTPTSLLCNGQCVTTCDGCSAGPAVCPTTRTCGTCANCAGFDIQCFTCTDGGAPASFCGQTGSLRCGTAPRCGCAGGDAAACPGPNQICGGDAGSEECFSCGEIGTDNKTCTNGKACSETELPPVCDRDAG